MVYIAIEFLDQGGLWTWEVTEMVWNSRVQPASPHLLYHSQDD